MLKCLCSVFPLECEEGLCGLGFEFSVAWVPFSLLQLLGISSCVSDLIPEITTRVKFVIISIYIQERCLGGVCEHVKMKCLLPLLFGRNSLY